MPPTQAPLYTPARVSLHVFFNPELVERLAACGISARARPPGSPAQGFVVGGRVAGGTHRQPVTHAIEAREHLTITAQRRLSGGHAEVSVETPGVPIPPQTALGLTEECERLQRDNQRLTGEVRQLRSEIERLTTRQGLPEGRLSTSLDDASQRFSLLELD